MTRFWLGGIVLLFPVLAGLVGAVLPAFNWFPPLGRVDFGIAPFVDLVMVPGFFASLWLTVLTGCLALGFTTIIGLILPGFFYDTKYFHWLRRYMAPVLSLPHVTVAVGVMFLLQPSGWLFRLISPVLTGWDVPPDIALVPDDYGLTLAVGLVAKEVPFMVLIMLAAIGQIDTARLLVVSRSLGYSKMKAWCTIIIPQLWPRIRLVVMIIAVFSLSVIDMAAVLAPSTPPPLSIRSLGWYQDPDLAQRFVASAAAVLQLLIALGGIGLVLGGEKLLARLCRVWLVAGGRGRIKPVLASIVTAFVLIIGIMPLLLAAFGMLAALIWSVASFWRFPDAWPAAFTLRYWEALSGGLGDITLNTLLLGFVSSGLSLLLAILWLEAKNSNRLLERAILLPLLIPQIGFLFGLQVMLLWFGFDGHVLAIIWAHSLYVFPYIWLALAPSWRAWNPQWEQVAAALGQGPIRRLLSVKMPMLLTPTLTAFAIGFSVSAALYLPTVFAGNARYQTLTVEAVVLASAAGRQPLGVATGMQMLLPLGVFVLISSISRWRFRRYSGIA